MKQRKITSICGICEKECGTNKGRKKHVSDCHRM